MGICHGYGGKEVRLCGVGEYVVTAALRAAMVNGRTWRTRMRLTIQMVHSLRSGWCAVVPVRLRRWETRFGIKSGVISARCGALGYDVGCRWFTILRWEGSADENGSHFSTHSIATNLRAAAAGGLCGNLKRQAADAD